MEKKKSLIQRAKDRWNRLSFTAQIAIVCGLNCVGGALFGSAVQNVIDQKRTIEYMRRSYDDGVKDGKLDAYRDVAMNNPFVNDAKKF